MAAMATYGDDRCWQEPKAKRRCVGDEPGAGAVRSRPSGLSPDGPSKVKEYQRSGSRPSTRTDTHQLLAAKAVTAPVATAAPPEAGRTCQVRGTSPSADVGATRVQITEPSGRGSPEATESG
jgi:hypothetical protein